MFEIFDWSDVGCFVVGILAGGWVVKKYGDDISLETLNALWERLKEVLPFVGKRS